MRYTKLCATLAVISTSLAQNASMTIPTEPLPTAPPIPLNGSTLVPSGSNYSGNIQPITWSTRPEVYDHNGIAVRHGRARLNDIRMHYYISGSGPPLLLIHGTPKTNYYWYKLVPLLTPYFTVVAPDVRGFGYTDKPPAAMGYNNTAQAADMAGLMSLLGFDRFYVHGEDRGAEYAYAVAATYRERVIKLSFCEMLLSGVSLDTWSYFTPENVNAQYELRGVWQWHIPFLWMPNVAEMLITGKEAEFWTYFMEAECYNPILISREAITEWINSIKAPGGLQGVLETYRADLVNRQINTELRKNLLTLPVMTIGAPEFFGVNVREEMLLVANNVQQSYIFEECGHSLALEAEVRLANALVGFFLGNGSSNSTSTTSTSMNSTATI